QFPSSMLDAPSNVVKALVVLDALNMAVRQRRPDRARNPKEEVGLMQQATGSWRGRLTWRERCTIL
ncbi:MAG: hypothetical protein V3T20_08580, partial [Gemmatimonadota bacterium]